MHGMHMSAQSHLSLPFLETESSCRHILSLSTKGEKNKNNWSIAGELRRNPKEARAFRVSKELDAGAKRWTRARATIKFLYL